MTDRLQCLPEAESRPGKRVKYLLGATSFDAEQSTARREVYECSNLATLLCGAAAMFARVDVIVGRRLIA